VRRIVLVVSATAGLLLGCDLVQPDQSLRVLLPEPPAWWQIAFPRLGFRVASRDTAGGVVEVAGSDWRRPVLLTCVRAANLPILAWPCVPAPRDGGAIAAGVLRPAGGVFPTSLRSWEGEAVVELTWEDGAAALVLDRSWSAGADLSRFNAARLVSFLRVRADPWTVDLDAAAQQIALGTFTAWDLDGLSSEDVCVDPGAGTWFLEDPLAPPVPAEGTRLRLKGVPRGTHRLFSLHGTCWRLQVGEPGPLLAPGP